MLWCVRQGERILARSLTPPKNTWKDQITKLDHFYSFSGAFSFLIPTLKSQTFRWWWFDGLHLGNKLQKLQRAADGFEQTRGFFSALFQKSLFKKITLQRIWCSVGGPLFILEKSRECATVWNRKLSLKKIAISRCLYLKLLGILTGEKNNFLSKNYQEFDVRKMWILWKMRLWKCEYYEKIDFENVNLVKIETLKMWILYKMRL